MNVQPTGISIEEGELLIQWSDGHLSRHSLATLRKLCPCATCVKEREKLEAKGPVLRVLSGPVVTEAKLQSYSLVGRYALGFTWNDGHSTGIYSYDFLRSHCICSKCLPKP